jgi:murein L,D-transpeptidase YafK
MNRRTAMSGGVLLLAAGCAGSKFRTYNGPEVTSIVAFKEARELRLYHGQEILRTYEFELGFAPEGDKTHEGDGRTPEGQYWINRRNPNSNFHLSLGISYPNAIDVQMARSAGVRPGGDIFIHGTPRANRGDDDWTVGCIAVTNPEMEEIYSMVNLGTPIWIYP